MNRKEANIAQKRLVAIRSRELEINTRFDEIKSKIETEKRKMDDKESEEFHNLSEEKDAILRERDVLRLGLENFRTGNLPSEQETNNRAAFTQLVVSVRNKQIVPEELRSMVDTHGDIVIPIARSLTDTAAIAPVIPLTVGELMMPLNNGIVYDKLGLKIQTGLKGQFQYPKITGVEATFEDENVEVTDQAVSITKLNGNPKRVSISVPVSNTAIDESNINLQSVVMELFTAAMSNLLNKWICSSTQLTKTVAAPKGPFVDVVATPAVSLAVGKTPTWKDVIALETAVQKKHLPITVSSCFICNSSMIADLRTTDKSSSSTATGRYIAEAVGKGEYQIDGFPVFVTEDVADGVLGFGVFEYDLLGQFGEVRLVVDPYTDAKKNITRFVFNTRWDNVILRPEAFAALVVAQG